MPITLELSAPQENGIASSVVFAYNTGEGYLDEPRVPFLGDASVQTWNLAWVPNYAMGPIANYTSSDRTTLAFVTDLESLQLIERQYAFLNSDKVRLFLLNRPQIANVLLEAVSPLEQSFGASPPLLAHIVEDPESFEQSLLVYIQTSGEPSVIRPLFKDFQRNWWLSVAPSLNGELSFGLKYI